MLGDAVNTAARIKSKRRSAGSRRSRTFAQARDFRVSKAWGHPAEEATIGRDPSGRGIRGSLGIGEERSPASSSAGRASSPGSASTRCASRAAAADCRVLGEEGIGKSRGLLTALASSRNASLCACSRERASSLAPDQPFQALAGLVRAAADRRRMPRALSAILDPRQVTPGRVEARVELERLLRDLAEEQPLVVLLDELQWADPASIDGLPSLLRIASELPLLFVLALRPDAGSPGERLLARLRDALRRPDLIALSLFRADSLLLLEELSGDAADSDEGARDDPRPRRREPRRLSMGSFLAGALSSPRERERAGDERSATPSVATRRCCSRTLAAHGPVRGRWRRNAIYPVVSECLALLREIAHKHGRDRRQFLGDCVLGLFGIPRAIEDAPRAAVNAAHRDGRGSAALQPEHALETALDRRRLQYRTRIAGEIAGRCCASSR